MKQKGKKIFNYSGIWIFYSFFLAYVWNDTLKNKKEEEKGGKEKIKNKMSKKIMYI